MTHPRLRDEACAPRVCAVVLNWNRADDTIECLESIMPIVRASQAVLLVCDNGSEDDSPAQLLRWAEKRFGRVSCASSSPLDSSWDFLLIRNHDNRGFGGGVNTALRIALRDLGLEYIWVLNNDSLIDERALTSLLACADKRLDAGLFGSTLVDYGDRLTVESAGGCRYNPATTVFSPILGGAPFHRALAVRADHRMDYVGGASMFFRAEALRRVGLFDERFFLYYEELDMARRLRAFGYSQAWCRNAIVYHKGAVSTGAYADASRETSWLSSYHENRSTLLFTRKHHPYLLPLAAVIRFAGKLIRCLRHGKWYRFSALLHAYQDFLLGVGGRVFVADSGYNVVFYGSINRHEECLK